MTGPGSQHRRRRLSALALSAATLLALTLFGWRALFVRLERSGTLASWANFRPERLRVEWRAIRSPWPGWIELEDLRVAGRTPRMLWELTADRASGSIEPHRLLLRELAWAAVRGEGVELRVARFPSAPGRVADPERLPRIEGLPAGPAPPPGPRPPWSFSFRGVEVEEVREVWVDDRLWRGRARGRGGFLLHRRTEAEVLDTEIEIERVDLVAAGRPVAESLTGRACFRIRRYPYRGARLGDIARRAEGRIDLEGGLEPDELVAYLFGGWQRLSVESRPSRVEATVVLGDGFLRPGTRLRITSPANSVRFLGFEAAGDARLDARAVGDFAGTRLESSLELGDWTMGRPGEPILLQGRGLRLEATARAGPVDRPPRATALVLDFGRARIPDLRFLNDLIPPAAGVEIESGAAEIGGSIRLASGAGGQEGALRVRGSRLALRVGGERMAADLEARIRLTKPDLAAAAFDLGGTRIFLRDFTAETSAGSRVSGWWGEVGLERGRIRLERPARLDARFDARLRDTRPLVAFYEIRRDLPRWAERLLTLEAVSISGRLDWSPGRLRVERGFLPLAHGELRGEVELEQEAKRGRLLATWRDLAVGLELDGDARELHLAGAREWWRDCCVGAEEPVRDGPTSEEGME